MELSGNHKQFAMPGLALSVATLAFGCWLHGTPAPSRVRHARPIVCAAMELESEVAATLDETTLDASAAAAADSRFRPPADPVEPDPTAVTLELLEWNRLCCMVASLAGTRRGRETIEQGLPVSLTREESETLHREMEEAYALEQVRDKKIEIRGFVDIRPLVTHATKGGSLDGENLVGIADSLEAAAGLVRTLRDESATDPAATTLVDAEGFGATPVTLLPSYFEGVPVQAEIRREIVNALDESGSVRDSADPALGELRFARREVAAAARRELGRLIQVKGEALASNTASIRDERYVLQVLAKQKHRVAGTVRDVSASGSTLFIEPKQIEPVNTKLQQLAKRERSIERAVLKKLSALVGAPKASQELLALQEAVTRVDCAAARARYSARLRGQPVVFRDPVEDVGSDGPGSLGLRLDQLRHPLLIWRTTAEQPEDSRMVPMDVAVPPGARAVVITGPNTGGKTVMLKTLGMAALMAKAGLRVLCAPDGGLEGRVTMPFFESVMADIGDDQSIVQSLSTFSAHVARMRRILAHAHARSGEALVLLDEVGSGTDPTEGSALGMAVLRQLVQDAALTLATTHHGRLKSLKYSDNCTGVFENACVEFDVASMAPTYRILWGIPGKSNALAIAERLGLQESVVTDARDLLEEEGGDGGADMEDILGALQSQREEQRMLNAELAALRDSTRREQAELTRRSQAAAENEASLKDQAQQQLEQELADARATIAELIRRAQSGGDQGGDALREAQRASQDLARLGEKSRTKAEAGQAQQQGDADPTATVEKLDPRSIVIGDRVLVPRLGEQLVDVESIQGSQLTVKYGGLKMKVKAKEVTKRVKAAPPPAPPPKKPKGVAAAGVRKKAGKGSVAVRFDSNTLDLRGQRPAEVEAVLGRAVDRAMSVGSLWVIHGHGTGSLKKRVRELLAEEPAVKRVTDAPQNEGGSGCSVAYFS